MNVAAEVVLNHLVLDETQEDLFRSVNENEGSGQVFGGQLMAQALVAATRTVPPEKKIVSFHSIFTSRGDTSEPIEYNVDRIRDGNVFATRSVRAAQADSPHFYTSVSFQAGEEGLEHCDAMPAVSTPEACAALPEVVAAYRELYPDHLPEVDTESLPVQAVDMRFADIDRFIGPSIEATDQLVWIKFDADVGPDQERHKQLLAYASDQSLSHIVAQPHGLGGLNPKLRFVSLEHSMWFHRPFRVDDWLLLVRRCRSATAGRALVNGEIFSSDGALVAMLAQEALVRFS